MHAVIRRYRTSRDVLDEARPQLDHLAQTMRQTPGFVAYYFMETPEGLATITVTEDETGTSESMGRAAQWVRERLPQTGTTMSAPEVTTGQVHMHVTPEGGDLQRVVSLASRYAMRVPTNAVRGDGTTTCPSGYPVKGNTDSGIYHTPDSPSYGQTIAEFCFASPSAAEAAGFQAAGS